MTTEMKTSLLKNDGTIELVINFRKLVTILIGSEYPIPTIDELIQSIMELVCAMGTDFNVGMSFYANG